MAIGKLVLVVFAALLALCATVFGLSVAFAREAEEALTVHEPVRRVVVATDAGNVVVRAGRAGAPVTIRRHARWLFGEPQLETAVAGGRLAVRARCGGAAVGPCATDLELSVPEDADVTVTTGAGDVDVRGLAGRLDLAAETGDVSADDVRPFITRAVSSGGDVALAFRNPPLQVVAGSDAGDIVIAVPAGDDYRIDSESPGGELVLRHVFRNDLASRRIVAETDAGDVRIVGR